MASKKYTLNKKDGKKIAKGAGIAMGGALLAYALQVLPQVDFGEYQMFAAVLSMVLVNVSRKYFEGN